MTDTPDKATRHQRLELPNEPVSTPCFVIFEEQVRHNLHRTAEACGGIHRLMPHLKTHRAPWIVQLLLSHGVTAFKAATPAEVEMAIEAGARNVTWAYTTANSANIRRVVECARRYPDAQLVGLIDCERGLDTWKAELSEGVPNVKLRIDLDPGLGRTGVAMSEAALELARAVDACGRFAGWHIYDGHIKGERGERELQVAELAKKLTSLQDRLTEAGIEGDAIGGGSYTFDIWPTSLVRYVSPGSWTYSSAQHDIELYDLEWKPAAFVLATVVSTHRGTATLDAGSKAISPDKPLAERFRWGGKIILMNEEHTIVEADDLAVGDRVFLLPQHACTTAYLYDAALVRTSDGRWERRLQLGSAR